jgi:hypothetical protein
MKIPTGHLRLLQDPRSDAVPPRLQQWWIPVSDCKAMPTLVDSWLIPHKGTGEWIDVPTVYGESDV